MAENSAAVARIKAIFEKNDAQGNGRVGRRVLRTTIEQVCPENTWTTIEQAFPGDSDVPYGDLLQWIYSTPGAPRARKAIFFDMVHSNNAARIRLWIALKGMQDRIETRVVTYPDLQTEEFAKVNPLRKVPALIDESGATVFESAVILEYLDDAHRGSQPDLKPATAQGRAFVNLLMRVHDLYIASPNCTQPGFSHTQGSMYLAPYETKWCRAERCMDRPTRAAKLKELFKQMTWLEANIKAPYMAGDAVSLADCTWFPTCIFMEFMLPRVFGWFQIFHEEAVFPKLSLWFSHVMKTEAFTAVQRDIWNYWVEKEKEGQFESIKGELSDTNFKWVYP